MSELDLTGRVKALHTRSNGHSTGTPCQPGECPCVQCKETMEALSTIDGLPDRHLMKLSDGGWAIEHPLACRMELATRGLTLHDCELHQQARAILAEGLPDHLAENTYEVEWRNGELRVHGIGDSMWYPLRLHDPASGGSRPGH